MRSRITWFWFKCRRVESDGLIASKRVSSTGAMEVAERTILVNCGLWVTMMEEVRPIITPKDYRMLNFTPGYHSQHSNRRRWLATGGLQDSRNGVNVVIQSFDNINVQGSRSINNPMST